MQKTSFIRPVVSIRMDGQTGGQTQKPWLLSSIVLAQRGAIKKNLSSLHSNSVWCSVEKTVATNVTSLCWASTLGSQHDAIRICWWAPAAGVLAIDRYVLQKTALSSKPAGRRWCRSMRQANGRRTNGRTPDRYLNPAPIRIGLLCGQHQEVGQRMFRNL